MERLAGWQVSGRHETVRVAHHGRVRRRLGPSGWESELAQIITAALASTNPEARKEALGLIDLTEDPAGRIRELEQAAAEIRKSLLAHRRRRERAARPPDASRLGSQHPSSMPRAAVPFFFKQWGGTRKHETGRTLDGRTYDEFPLAFHRVLAASSAPRASVGW
jgi:hypothetical protein